MLEQHYTPLQDEENDEEDALQQKSNITGWIDRSNVSIVTINAIVLIIGLVAGSLLSDTLRRGSYDRFDQYSLVPCMSAILYFDSPSDAIP
jgi:hypothetical protein